MRWSEASEAVRGRLARAVYRGEDTIVMLTAEAAALIAAADRAEHQGGLVTLAHGALSQALTLLETATGGPAPLRSGPPAGRGSGPEMLSLEEMDTAVALVEAAIPLEALLMDERLADGEGVPGHQWWMPQDLRDELAATVAGIRGAVMSGDETARSAALERARAFSQALLTAPEAARWLAPEVRAALEACAGRAPGTS